MWRLGVQPEFCNIIRNLLYVFNIYVVWLPSYQPGSNVNFQTANPGDVVVFTFKQKNHTVTESTFAQPCTDLSDGFDSGLWVPISGSVLLSKTGFQLNPQCSCCRRSYWGLPYNDNDHQWYRANMGLLSSDRSLLAGYGLCHQSSQCGPVRRFPSRRQRHGQQSRSDDLKLEDMVEEFLQGITITGLFFGPFRFLSVVRVVSGSVMTAVEWQTSELMASLKRQ
jgi:hypothetical protein